MFCNFWIIHILFFKAQTHHSVIAAYDTHITGGCSVREKYDIFVSLSLHPDKDSMQVIINIIVTM